ncbi:MAG: phosphoserine phosphatase SerB [Betaproteobacteria bacterium HGW-Betaproteobacteria-7]|jgi:phosphoserine phosphatase|uniref:phosphoserine phosphatase n=1 Tax=Candidatus Anoxymicrobium japonicum TaxID=2013648 RepID=A0A2N3G4W3_9ACTN|nr:MAG: phosphoserine phosphatase SerB [Betaproteobacteria bacterium HGW-Betaproteobacteria-7]PKQ27662.1 MAG: phosphoserine phosphatase SerB [Candidatus Anoxymicrobium japonicum]
MNLIIQGGALPTFLLERLVAATGAHAVEPRPPQVVRLTGASRTAEFEALVPLIEAEKLDWAFVQSGRKLSDFGLICFDMDSTLITIECIDELADFAGKKAEVSAVTEAAMRGEIDYRESLRRRLALLAGLDARVLARVFGERLLLSLGARELLEGCQAAGLRTAILSGGFTYFTERLRIELGFDFATSNELEISGGKLTGRVVGDIVDAAAKAHHLCRLRDELGLRKEQVIAVGDGANDLLMMAESGLSVAFQAKPATRAKADVAISCGGLDSLLNLFD